MIIDFDAPLTPEEEARNRELREALSVPSYFAHTALCAYDDTFASTIEHCTELRELAEARAILAEAHRKTLEFQGLLADRIGALMRGAA